MIQITSIRTKCIWRNTFVYKINMNESEETISRINEYITSMSLKILNADIRTTSFQGSKRKILSKWCRQKQRWSPTVIHAVMKRKQKEDPTSFSSKARWKLDALSEVGRHTYVVTSCNVISCKQKLHMTAWTLFIFKM